MKKQLPLPVIVLVVVLAVAAVVVIGMRMVKDSGPIQLPAKPSSVGNAKMKALQKIYGTPDAKPEPGAGVAPSAPVAPTDGTAKP